MTKLFLSPYLFFILRKGKVVCWDYKNHQQYELEEEHFNRLIEFSKNKDLPFIEMDQELKEADLIIPTSEKEEWGWDILSKIFHIGTQISKETDSEGDSVPVQCFSSDYLHLSEKLLSTSPSLTIEREGKRIALPPPDLSQLEKCTLLTSLRERKTCRSFNGEDIPLAIISILLSAVFGEIRSDAEEYQSYGYTQIGLRKSSPSGGGLHATEAYLIALHIEGLPKGVYHYQAHTHSLTLIQEIDLSSQLAKLFCDQYFAQDLSLGIFLTSRFDKLWHKYPHSRAYRIALLDVGHLSQTFQLATTALKLNPWLTGAFIDEEVIELLRIKDTCEQPLFFVGAGLGPKSALDPITKSLNAKEGAN